MHMRPSESAQLLKVSMSMHCLYMPPHWGLVLFHNGPYTNEVLLCTPVLYVGHPTVQWQPAVATAVTTQLRGMKPRFVMVCYSP